MTELAATPSTKPKRASKVPRCATCGRTLSRYSVKLDSRHRELAMGSARKSKGFIDWTNDDWPAMSAQIDAGDFTADGQVPTRGAYGDNLVCSQVCGHILAVRLIKALGIEVLSLLPEPWSQR